METMDSQKRANLAIGLTILVALVFLSPIIKLIQPVGFLFNMVFAGLIGFFFSRNSSCSSSSISNLKSYCMAFR